MNHRKITATVLVAALLPVAAQAHPGHETQAGLLAGLLHPLTGWDHLTVLITLGALAAGRRLRFIAGCAVLLTAALLGGAAFGVAFPAAPFVEPAILATVLCCAAMLAVRARVGRGALVAAIIAFMFIHGVAHGQEAPAGNLAAYFAGFAVTGLALFGASCLAMSRRTARRPAALGTRRHD